MLHSIQFNGSGPPTYIYSQKAAGASNEFYHVFAAETRGYKGRREQKKSETRHLKKAENTESNEREDFVVLDNSKEANLQEMYQREYGRRESFLWKQR